ncbi:MAG: AraC family transcriptional regulator [Lachnospiraceae bacterium]|nr:AraC family transcriptional regulator [Lachnospiraceae bacterium]
MKELSSCKQAMENCMNSETFAVAHLYKEEKAMDMHVHDCLEIYYSISGGRQFLIDNKLYNISPGDLFIINQYESHCLTQVDKMVHERIVISVHPDFIKALSTEETNLGACFTERGPGFSHRLSLSREQQQRFLYLINKITGANDYAHDVIERAAFAEMLILINSVCMKTEEEKETYPVGKYNRQVDEILAYINRNISGPISVAALSEKFFLSESYICRIFKAATGTTITKYVTARRITIAKAMLGEGKSVGETFEQSGFADYSSFFKVFTKTVGISPKKYAQYSNS